MNNSLTGLMVLASFAMAFYGIYMIAPAVAYIFAGIVLFWIAVVIARPDKPPTKVN
jgi:hypothetical protein